MNAATTVGHTCDWSVGQGNAVVAMPMIRLRCGGGTILLEPLEDPDDPSPSTKCFTELAKHLDISLGVDCHTPLVVVPWAVDNKSLWQQQRCVVSLMISVVQSVIVC